MFFKQYISQLLDKSCRFNIHCFSEYGVHLILPPFAVQDLGKI